MREGVSLALLLTVVAAIASTSALAAPPIYRVDHRTDGDTIVLKENDGCVTHSPAEHSSSMFWAGYRRPLGSRLG